MNPWQVYKINQMKTKHDFFVVVQLYLRIRLTKDEENLKDDIADTACRMCIGHRKAEKFKIGKLSCKISNKSWKNVFGQ